MLRFSKIALAAALLAGTSGILISAPVQAQKKDEPAPGLKFSSAEIVASIQAAKTALDARDIATAGPAVAQTETLIKNDDDKYAAATLRLVLESQKIAAARAANQPVSDAALAAPYDALLANPKTPPADMANYAFQRGVIAYNSRQYAQAATFYDRARLLGSTDPNLATQIVMAKVNSGDTVGGMTELDRIVTQTTAAGGKADEQLYRFAISKTVAARDNPGTLTWMKRYLVAHPTPKNWRDMIKIYGLQPGSLITPTRTQTLDLYRLMRATKSLAGQYDYEDYALRANQAGLPYEARTVITEGKAAGKIPASSTISNQLLKQANNSISIDGPLTPLEAKAKSAADGKLAAQTGDAQLGSGNYAKAIELYRVALQKGGANTNDVNIRLGIALAMTGDKAGAKTAFAAVTGAPSADIAGLWTSYLDGTTTAA